MKSMKLTKAETENASPIEAKAAAPQYPWGLRLELNDETMKKLGLKELPDVGEKMVLKANVVVESVSQNDTKDGKRQNMSLQITDMDLGEAEKSEEPAEKKLYNTDGTVREEKQSSGKTILVDL
jgi:hypothetical protein